MGGEGFFALWGEAAKTAAGFFWKAGWAFVLGYFVSAMIQAFIPKGRLTPYMGGVGFKSIGLATAFGAISSSCSFAALATARSILVKGAHFVAAIAFMFASTNLVIELGVLILIFLGWQFLAAEIIGGLLLIVISRYLMVWTQPDKWLNQARKKAEEEGETEEDDFDWRDRIKSREGWWLVGHRFVMEWKMVWHEILIGFTVAGFVSVFVPSKVWEAIFLADFTSQSGFNFLVAVENALLAPFVAAATFIGSMGNIPLATVLNSNGVLFAGIMGFIYSDLMVPPLVAINAKYYGWRTALYIAGIMYVSIVATALILHMGFTLFDMVPESAKKVDEVARFKIDYTFWLNLVAVGLSIVLGVFHRKYADAHERKGGESGGGGGLSFKQIVVRACIVILVGGFVALLFT